MSLRPAALFDLDRTVLRIDTGTSWLRYQHRRGHTSTLGLARAAYWSLLYKMAWLDMEALATRLVADVAGDDEAEMRAHARRWFDTDVAHEVAPSAYRAIVRHRAAGDVLALATGSTQYAAEPAAALLGIDHALCSRLEIEAGRFTGRLAALCFGRHKVTLAERFAADHGVDLARSTFYTDSINDLPLLERVGRRVVVNPDPKLAVLARRRGWQIERWA